MYRERDDDDLGSLFSTYEKRTFKTDFTLIIINIFKSSHSVAIKKK